MGEPSSTFPHAGHIHTRLPSASWKRVVRSFEMLFVILGSSLLTMYEEGRLVSVINVSGLCRSPAEDVDACAAAADFEESMV